MLGAAVVGSLPVLWVLGAVPWRAPAFLVDYMFRGFTACALADGTLNPAVMMCPSAGVPLGMYQTDGGLSYPLGGVLIGLGIEPLTAWKISVALLIAPGFGALFWLVRRMTSSPVLAAVITALYGLNGTLTARTWNWPWNAVAVALLPVLFLLVYLVFDRAVRRRLRRLLLPGVGVVAAIVAIGVEWQYAGLFATAIAVAAMVVLGFRPGWAVWQRCCLAAGTALACAGVSATLRWRLAAAGIDEQFEDIFDIAVEASVDLVSFVVPDGRASILGDALSALGFDGLLVETFTDGRQAWVVPYMGVLIPVFLAIVLVARRRRLTPDPRLPAGYLRWLIIVTVASIVLALGPVLQVARLANPDAQVAPPLLHLLWTTTPLHWIRYPWTWAYVTHIALLLIIAAFVPTLLRPRRQWSPAVWTLAIVLALELVSPQVLEAFHSPQPSITTDEWMPAAWAPVAGDHPAVTRFESTQLPELRAALRAVDGTVVLLPWTNTWTLPQLVSDPAVRVRNVGIDRNFEQVEAVAPFTHHELRRPSAKTVKAMLDREWATAVVLLDHVPTTGTSIVRFESGYPDPDEVRWLRWVTVTERKLTRFGYCVEPHSWFTVIEKCSK